MSEATIERDVDCLACGYNLRGLRPDGVCPECGDRVTESLVDRGLAGADAGWRRTLRRGVAAGSMEYVAMMVLVPLSQVLDLDAVATWMVGAMGVSALLGGWWVTRPEPGRRQARLGVAVRGAAIGVAATYGGMLLMEENEWWPEWMQTVWVGFMAANAIKTGLQMGVLTRLARRAPGSGLARAGKGMVAVGPLVWGAMLAEQFIGAAAWVDWALIAGVALGCAAVVGYAVWFYVVLRERRAA